MKLNNLRPLYKSMKELNQNRVKFSAVVNKVAFEVIYFIDDQPHSLAVGVRSENFFFEVPVYKGFVISSYLGEHYARLYQILGLKPNSNNAYSPKIFFEQIDKNIPPKANGLKKPTVNEVFSYRRNVEEADKIYFLTWRDNNSRNARVSQQNLEKTRKLLSYEAYEMCKRKNISSCRTDDPTKASEFLLPTKLLKDQLP